MMKTAVALLRVSTDKQYEFGDSIETQRTKIDHAAARNGFEIVRYFAEHYSGRSSQRDTIDEMLDFLAAHQDEISAVYICQIDRFTRGGSDAYLQLRKKLYALNVDLVDAYGVIQKRRNTLEHTGFGYDWSMRSSSEMAEVLLAEQAKSEASDILTRTIGQQIKLAQDGYQVREANFGYTNEKCITDEGKKRTIMKPHAIEAPLVRMMFELRAASDLSDGDICERLNAMGYRSRKRIRRDKRTRQPIGLSGQRPLHPKQLERYISRTIYCGYRIEKWTHDQPVKAPFEPLVSVDLFNRANRGKTFIKTHRNGTASIEYNKRNYRSGGENPAFFLRHVVLCPQCRKPFLGSHSKGKYNKFGYYHCSRGHKYLGIPTKEFEETVGYYLKSLEPKPGFFGLFKEVVREVWIERNQRAKTERSSIDEHVSGLVSRQENLLGKLETCQSNIVQSKLEQQVEALEVEINKTKQQRNDHDLSEDQIEAYFEVAKDTIEHPEKYVFAALDKPKLLAVWSLIFREAPTFTDLENGTPELRLYHRLSGLSQLSKRQLASQLDAQWNLFVDDVEFVLLYRDLIQLVQID